MRRDESAGDAPTSRSWSARVDEYVDSPRLRRRRRTGDDLRGVVDGNYGTYHVGASLRAERASSCTCPCEFSPCKHVAALRETYEVNPRSFLDASAIERGVADLDHDEALELLARIARRFPVELIAAGTGAARETRDTDGGEDFGIEAID